MDFRRHVTAGRLAELFGEDALETDKFVRTLGWRDVAEEELPLLSPDDPRATSSRSRPASTPTSPTTTARGSRSSTPRSGSTASTTPRRSGRRPTRCLAEGDGLGPRRQHRRRDRAVARVRPTSRRAQIAELFPDYPYAQHQPIVDPGRDRRRRLRAERQPRAAPGCPSAPRCLSDDAGGDAAPSAQASVDAVQTRLLGARHGHRVERLGRLGRPHRVSGAPILANDPHLGADDARRLVPDGPALQRGRCRACPFDVTGFTFAGLPGVVIGHNADIAWGFTNLYPDVQDLYLEKVSDDNTLPVQRQAAAADDPRGDVRRSRGEDPVTITVRESRHGPLISDVSQDYSTVGADAPVPRDGARSRQRAMPSRCAGPRSSRAAPPTPCSASTRRTDWDSTSATRPGRSSRRAQNLVYADAEGHIGYQAPGRIPIRRTGHGDWPVPGWDPAYEWAGYIPFDALPNVLDPKDGYVVTANQAVVEAELPLLHRRLVRLRLSGRSGSATCCAEPTIADRRRHGHDPARRLQRAGASG